MKNQKVRIGGFSTASADFTIDKSGEDVCGSCTGPRYRERIRWKILSDKQAQDLLRNLP
jgi:hypothetical protein